MSNKRLSSWCSSILPANYQQIKSQTSKYQQFLREQLPDSFSDSVQVVNVNKEAIVVAVSSAAVTNFLRMHIREIQQQIHETFIYQSEINF